MALRAKVYANYGVELQPPAHISTMPSNWAQMTPEGQKRVLAQKKVDFQEWKTEMAARRTAAEKTVDRIMAGASQARTFAQSDRSAEARRAASDDAADKRIAAQSAAQMQAEKFKAEQQDKTEKFKADAATALAKKQADAAAKAAQVAWNRDISKPLNIDDRSLLEADDPSFTSVTDHITKIMPTAFADPKKPKEAADNFTNRFDAETQGNLADAVLDTARWTHHPPTSVARSIASLVTPMPDGRRVNFGKSTDDNGLVHLALPSGVTLAMEPHTLTLLDNVFAAQKQKFKEQAVVATEKADRTQKVRRLQAIEGERNAAGGIGAADAAMQESDQTNAANRIDTGLTGDIHIGMPSFPGQRWNPNSPQRPGPSVPLSALGINPQAPAPEQMARREALPPTSPLLSGAPVPPEGARARALDFTAPRPRDAVPEISVDPSRIGRWNGPAPPRRTVSPSDIFPARQAIPLTESTSRALDTVRARSQEAKQDAEREKRRKWPNDPAYDNATSVSR
jgi:hypothetical protein